MNDRIAIIGSGIHGASIAYYLSKRGYKPIIFEKSKPAAAASGKSGGFLAREWGSGPTDQLHKISFDMHEALSLELGLKSYRRIPTVSVAMSKRKKKPVVPWLDGDVSVDSLGGATAQVNPHELTTKFLEASLQLGAEIVIDEVVGITVDKVNNRVQAVKLKNRADMEFDKIVLTSGPWSGVLAEDWFGLHIPMQGIKSTSIVYNDVPGIDLTQHHACFCGEDRNGCHLEIYPRPDKQIYICGIGGSDYVSGDRLRSGGDCDDPAKIVADPNRVSAAMASLSDMSSAFQNLSPDTVQACMRPCTTDALPVMGQILGIQGAYISAGHNCWGILWAPVSGLSMSELIADGKSHVVDLTPFDPNRFMATSQQRSRGRKMGSVELGEQW